jgi:hypothetical protein
MCIVGPSKICWQQIAVHVFDGGYLFGQDIEDPPNHTINSMLSEALILDEMSYDREINVNASLLTNFR